MLVYLKGQAAAGPAAKDLPQTAVERMRWKASYSLLRHHFGLPALEDTRRGIVEAHGGQIGVSSPSGQGARFFFTLPRGKK